MTTTTMLVMYALPLLAIAVIVMLARNWVTPVEHPEDESQPSKNDG